MNSTETINKNNKKRPRVLGYPVDIMSIQQVNDCIGDKLTNQQQSHVVTINPEMIMQAGENQELSTSLCNADLNVPDGIGVYYALKIKGYKISSTVPGIEVAEAALKYCTENSIKIAFLGSKSEVIQLMLANMEEKYPGLDVCYYRDGYFSEDEEEQIAMEISKTDPGLLLVALGVPKQEIWINKFKSLFPNTVMIGVGGSFDVWSGYVKRAPEIFRNLGLEWLYRLLSQPYRAKRILISLPLFVLKVLIFDRK